MFPRGRGPHSCVFVPSGPPFAHATNVLQRVPWPLPPPADSCYTTRAGVQDLKVRSAVSAARTSLWLATTTPRAHGHARPVSLIWLLPYPGLCPWLRERQGPTREAIRKRALGVDHQAATRPRCAKNLCIDLGHGSHGAACGERLSHPRTTTTVIVVRAGGEVRHHPFDRRRRHGTLSTRLPRSAAPSYEGQRHTPRTSPPGAVAGHHPRGDTNSPTSFASAGWWHKAPFSF